MAKLYHRPLPKCADFVLPPTNMLSGPKGQLELTHEALTAFEGMENSLADVTLLTNLVPETRLSLMLLPAEIRYSTFDRELFALYLAVKHSRNLHENRDFTVFTDHKPLTFALRSHSDKCNLRVISHLNYISQFTTEIHHTYGTKNEVADMLFRPSLSSFELSYRIDLFAMVAKRQRVGCLDDGSAGGLRFKDILLTNGTGTIFCDVLARFHRPFMPA
ncbi:hypothetical protein SprV_0200679700 [Sparganum proliferum]